VNSQERALAAQRRELFPRLDDDARFRKARADTFPPNTARAADGWTPRQLTSVLSGGNKGEQIIEPPSAV
jgi:uncharacterized protein with von Willebrand factor type A (vWA) domain